MYIDKEYAILEMLSENEGLSQGQLSRLLDISLRRNAPIYYHKIDKKEKYSIIFNKQKKVRRKQIS